MKLFKATLWFFTFCGSIQTHAASAPFQIGFLPYPAFGAERKAASVENEWRELLQKPRKNMPGMLVLNGIKSNSETCSDELFQQRKSIIENARLPVVLSLAAQDWSECLRQDGSNQGVERLNLLRNMFFAQELLLGATAANKLEWSRQAFNPRYRDYVEHQRWEKGNILFATLNLPANNNRYRLEAGRNSEYEDRMVANRDWLQKLFAQAKAKKRQAVVLIADGNLMGNAYLKSGKPRPAVTATGKDGFAELQSKLLKLAESYPGRVLVVSHSETGKIKATLQWRGRIGILSIPQQSKPQIYVMQINPQQANPFAVN
ncbi:hypothetical protein V8J88_16225 [Massilia sp. W12]|uniref:hypothetical protein n=1 Tax=Massilia sp. W12 TaxID=3126507 RepID=UPI0030D42A7A